MSCQYDGYRAGWEGQAARAPDAWILMKLGMERDWDCSPHLWSILRCILKREVTKRGLEPT